MKTIVVLCFCLVAVKAITDDQHKDLARYRSECLAETHADEDLVMKLNDGNFETVNKPLQMYTLCVMMKAELLTKDGDYRKDVGQSKVAEEDRQMASDVADLCTAQQTNGAPEEKAWQYTTCLHKNFKEYSIFQ